jgi:peptidoglycan glycosyltransferase
MQTVCSIKNKKMMLWIIIVSAFLLVALIVRLGIIQFVDGNKLKQMAYEQQTLNRKITSKRGTIYDATGKNILAQSSTVETVTVNSTNIPEDKKEIASKALSEILNVDYEKTLKKVKKRSSIETIAKKVDKEKTNELRKWMKENNIQSGINIDEDTKRYYPYSNLASHIIGFCGSDNQGLDGIEAKYDEILKGKSGKIEKLTDAKGGDMKQLEETYVAAERGKDLILTIDLNIQSIAEKYLENACIDNKCTDGGNVVIMNPNNGDILAMATYPNYDLNNPYEIENSENMDSKEKNKELQAKWRNKAIADTYEPGSTFKLITSSIALEEGITKTDNEGEFNCGGGIEIAGVRIKCWRYYRPHGAQSLRQALMNSCNPVFIALGQKIGKDKYYDYLEKFGFFRKTNIDLPGEAKGIFLDKEKVGPVELATISFGQRFEVTPLQMVTAVSCIANGGEYIQPRVVKEIIDPETKEKTEIDVKNVERVISKETADSVLSIMQSVVDDGTGRNAQVKGYLVGGKTGTSEDGVNTNKYVTSFMGVAPISNPQVVILVTLYNPTGEGGHQGGGVAAPVGGQILGEVLPYLELKQDKETEEKLEEIETPELRNKTVKEAKQIVKELGVNLEINNMQEEIDENEVYVKEQIPKPGIKITKERKVYIDI